jgi:transcription initiation factor TFIIIB Brf1 subunit/transcription initiation factor TFIIB
MLKKIRKSVFIMRIMCPECGSKKIQRKIGEVSCTKCGLVIDENMVMCE